MLENGQEKSRPCAPCALGSAFFSFALIAATLPPTHLGSRERRGSRITLDQMHELREAFVEADADG